jgi:hypothetical protein
MAARVPTRQKTQNPRLNMKFFNIGSERTKNGELPQIAKTHIPIFNLSRI